MAAVSVSANTTHSSRYKCAYPCPLHLAPGAAATGFGRWLAAHGHKLSRLSITEYFFAHHGHYGPAAAAAGQGIVRSRLGPIARVALWQGLHAGGRPMLQLHTLKVNTKYGCKKVAQLCCSNSTVTLVLVMVVASINSSHGCCMHADPCSLGITIE